MADKKRLGILGGMGPQATVYMFQKIVDMTKAERDQDHLEIFIHNNTNVPDRTEAILYDGESPLEELIRSARILEQMGAEVLTLPCMTSHVYFHDLQESTTVPIINAIEQSVVYISHNVPNVKNVGILATTGTIKSRLFQKSLVQRGFNPLVVPDDIQHTLVMSAIYGDRGIKAGFIDLHTKGLLLKAAEQLIRSGAEAIIAGCTEIPLVIEKGDLEVPVIDTIEVLAEAAIRKCLGEYPGS